MTKPETEVRRHKGVQAPPEPYRVGDEWHDTTPGYSAHKWWNGECWEAIHPKHRTQGTP